MQQATVETSKQLPQPQQWAQNLETLRNKEAEARARLAETQDTRKRVALDAELGDAKAKQQLAEATVQLRQAELELETLDAAIEQATARLTDSQRVAERARRDAQLDHLRELFAERLKNCKGIETATKVLATHVAGYNANTRALVALLGTTSRQLPSAWRLRTFIDHTLGFHLAPTGYRDKPLSELEQPVLDALIRTASKEEI